MANFEKLANQKRRTELRTQMDFKGINILTRAKLKLMAANRGIPLYQLLDEIVGEAFKKEEDTLAKPGVVRRFLRRWQSCSELRCKPLVHHGNWCNMAGIGDHNLNVGRYSLKLMAGADCIPYPLSQSGSKLRLSYCDTFASKMRKFQPIITPFWQIYCTKERNLENSIA